MSTIVTWVRNGNGEYEISSPNHLKQLMNEGSLYTDAGTSPFSYWANVKYIQTADIDLLNDSTNIKPIGNSTTQFLGSYDGGEYSISNYSYLDPNFSTTNSCVDYVGLFGYSQSNYLKNIRLDGVWTIEGFSARVGFLCGNFLSDTVGVISNIEGNFSTGSFINTNNEDPFVHVGSLIGFAVAFTVTSLTVKGSIDFIQDKNLTNHAGGIIASTSLSNDNCSISMLRNLATFPSGISGRQAGGIIGTGTIGGIQNGSFTNFINCMVGDVFGNSTGSRIGGIIGGCSVTQGSTSFANNMVNAMTGDIYTGVTNAYIGGIMGLFGCFGSVPTERLLNYMTGDIYMTGNTSINMGGLIGYSANYSASNGVTGTITNSINAMNGNVAGDALFGDFLENSPIPINNITNTNFGLTFTSNTFNNGTPTGLLTNSEFTDLPYFDIIGTDDDGNAHDFEFAYGNLSGNSSYPNYTHLVLHRTDISTPYDVTYGIPSNNTTVYLTYVNIQTMTVYQPTGLTGTTVVLGVTISVPSLLSVTVRSINIPVVITAVSGAIEYRLTIEGPTGGEVIKVSGTTLLEHNITGIEAETQYTLRMYANTGSGYELSEETVVTTLVNTATNYEITDFEVDGLVNISSLGAELDVVIDDLFNTGDIVGVSLSSNPILKSSFIKNGETLSIKDVDSTLIPFSTSSGTGQNVNVLLSDDVTTVPITYDETNQSITINSVTYNTGDSFILDGKKVTIYNI